MTDVTGRQRRVADEIIERYPRLYHMAHHNSWKSIREHGLHSTRSLLDLYEVDAEKRERILTEHRPEIVPIEHRDLGRAYVRDQKPMSDKGLRRALEESDLEPSAWYELLNEKVFFWLTRDRLNRMLNARAYREDPHDVLVVDTEGVIEAHRDSIMLSSMNSGCTKPYPHSRGRDTIQSLEKYPFYDWDKKRSGTEPVVELAVVGAVPDICEYVVRVEVRRSDELLDVKYEG